MISRRLSPGLASRSIRSMFSTMTMVPSTIMPMAMARPPNDIRLADMPKRRIPMNATSTEKGIDNATTTLARTPPMKTSSTIHHQSDANNQRGGDGSDGGLHQALLLVVGHDPYALGQDVVDLVELLFDGADDGGRVGAEELDHLPRNHLSDAVSCLDSTTNRPHRRGPRRDRRERPACRRRS